MSPPVLALLASQVRADERRLIDALRYRSIPFEQVDAREFRSTAGGLRSGGAGLLERWSAVLNREIGQARAVYAARSLEALGVPVLNSAAATEVCGDKWLTTLALDAAGLPQPRTALALTPEAALAALDDVGYPAVIKPLVGSWGRLVVDIADRRAAQAVLQYVAALPAPASHLVYVQQLIAKPGRDIRALVVGGVLIGAVYRVLDGVVTNVSRGAVTVPCPPTPELERLATAAANAVGAQIAGVDLIEDVDGRLLLLEVNHRVEFGGLQAALGDRVDVADAVVAHVAARTQREPAW